MLGACLVLQIGRCVPRPPAFALPAAPTRCAFPSCARLLCAWPRPPAHANARGVGGRDRSLARHGARLPD
eukprot:364464-Chlamydomonas_euryale.AAC.11